MAQVVITIDTDSDAFVNDAGAEIGNILYRVGIDFSNWEYVPGLNESIRDSNGNTCGSVSYE